MEDALTTATWFWLLVPMPLCVALSVITWLGARRG
ncbi:hypothetical protein KBTX_00127 [wastewater metagenome]|uniref:Uncharacterized protein n=2 Tax=unclassified sequences TaxID=12908 RepID=A0A5B8RAX6_9ZZZZ|nr:hypothetical protein KBTEX_00127 [uncultured organism]